MDLLFSIDEQDHIKKQLINLVKVSFQKQLHVVNIIAVTLECGSLVTVRPKVYVVKTYRYGVRPSPTLSCLSDNGALGFDPIQLIVDAIACMYIYPVMCC